MVKRVKVIEEQWGGSKMSFFGYIDDGKTKKNTITYDEYRRFGGGW